MNIKLVAQTLEQTFRYNMTTKRHEDKITPMIWGPPGIGKSDLVYQVAELLGYRVIEIRLNSLNPVDVRGFPFLNEETRRGDFALPYYFPLDDEPVILFLDEIDTAPLSNQVVAYELTQNYSIGGRKLPNNVLIVGAGNGGDGGDATYDMPPALANRLQHLYAQPSKAAFVEYAISHSVNSDIVGFVQFKPTLLHSMSEEKAYPTPRSWVKLSNLSSFVGEVTQTNAESLVGRGAAGELMAYIELKSRLPDIDKALDEGIPFQTGERSLMFSFVTAITYKLNTEPTDKRFENYLKIIGVIPAELQAVSIHMLSKETKKRAIQSSVSEKFYELTQQFN